MKAMVQLTLRVALWGVWISSAATSFAAVVTIDENTTIDASSSISGSSIEVINGPGGAAAVEILSGGVVQGFYGRQDSHIILDGGHVTSLSSLSDHATYVQRNGRMGCDTFACLVSDYDAELIAEDSSTLHFYGGEFAGIVRLKDMSMAHFYGENLELKVFDPGFAYVEGSYADGSTVGVAFHFRPDIASQIVLHNVPEPGAIAGLVVLTFSVGGCWHRRRAVRG
jgi:hypothetical protein